jgi:hypothetical protein
LGFASAKWYGFSPPTGAVYEEDSSVEVGGIDRYSLGGEEFMII